MSWWTHSTTFSHSSFPLYFNQFFWFPTILQSLHVLSHQVSQVNIKITKGHFMWTKSWHCQFLSVHFHDQYIVKNIYFLQMFPRIYVKQFPKGEPTTSWHSQEHCLCCPYIFAGSLKISSGVGQSLWSCPFPVSARSPLALAGLIYLGCLCERLAKI